MENKGKDTASCWDCIHGSVCMVRHEVSRIVVRQWWLTMFEAPVVAENVLFGALPAVCKEYDDGTDQE